MCEGRDVGEERDVCKGRDACVVRQWPTYCCHSLGEPRPQALPEKLGKAPGDTCKLSHMC